MVTKYNFFIIVWMICSVANAQNNALFWTEGFEEADGETYTTSTDPIPIFSNTWSYEEDNRGRLRFDVTSYSGSNAATLDVSDNNRLTINYLTSIIDISSYSNPEEMYLSFVYMQHGEEEHDNDRVWVRLGNDDSNPWVEAYDLYANRANAGTWNEVNDIDIKTLLLSQWPNSYLQIRIGQEDNYPVNPSLTANDGMTFDDIELVASNIEAPLNFTADNLTSNSVDLSWDLNTNSDPVVVSVNLIEASGYPIIGTEYTTTTNNTMPDGSTVIYNGSLESYTYSGINPSSYTYFKIWSYDSSTGEYSLERSLKVMALSASTIFYEDFESGSSGWTLGSSGNTDWYVGSAEAYMGNNSAYVTTDNGNSASYDIDNGPTTVYLEQDIDLSSYTNYKSAELSFYWKCVGEPGYDGGSVRENNTYLIDNLELAGQETWVEETIDITDYLGSNFDMRFRWYHDWYAGENPGLCIDEITITGSEVARPESFSGDATSSSSVDLTWTKSVDDDQVIIAYSPYGAVGRPENGTVYTEGDYFTGGGEVIYIGSASSYTHSGEFEGELSYSIWSVNTGTYSSALSTKVKIPVSLPFSEDFEGTIDSWNLGTGYENAWTRGKAVYYNGAQSAYISPDNGITASYNEVWTDTDLELDIDLRGFATASLTFYWMSGGDRNDAYGECYIGGSRISNQQEYKEYTSGWREEIIDLSSYTGDIRTLKFKWYNNTRTAKDPGFCIDDIYITGTIEDPGSFSATNSNTLYNDLIWTQNSYSDDVIVAWSTDGVFGTPQEGEIYEEGDELSGGGSILYVGSDLSEVHEPLKYGTVYYYKIWSVRNGIYSTGLTSSASTPSKVTVLTEDWEDSNTYSNWTAGTGTNYWLLGGTDKVSSGTYSAYITTDGTTAGYDRWRTTDARLTVEINLTDLTSASLSFDWLCLGEDNWDYGEVYLEGVLISDSKAYVNEGDVWQSEQIDLTPYITSSDQTLEFRFTCDNNTGSNPGFCIDNIEVGGIYAATSLLDNGNQLNSTINSTYDTSGEALSVFEFDFTDKTSLYNDYTRIQQVVISKGSSNGIDDWSDAIGGALLFGPDIDASGLEGVVSSSSITFTGSDMIVLENQDSPETYYFKVWLNSNLNEAGVYDNDIFDFAVESEDIVTSEGDDFIAGQVVSSGAVSIAVSATGVEFSQQPSEYGTVNVALTTSPEVSAIDENGNVDVDFENTVTITNSETIGMSPTDVTAVDGIATFTGLTFTSTGIVTLDASYVGFDSATSDEIEIQNYCVPELAGNTNLYISNVILNTINNATENSIDGYGMYLDQNTSLSVDVDYDITIGINAAYTGANVAVWIDWDQSETFDDDEIEFSGTVSSMGISSLSGIINVPNDVTLEYGATRMRVQVINGTNTSCVSNSSTEGETEDYTVILTQDGWQGASTLWSVGQNWSSGSVPTSTTDVYIPEYPYYGQVFPVVNSETISMNNLEIASNASLTIKAGSQVDVLGDVVTNDGLYIENTTSSPSTFITEGTVTGNANVNWPLTERVWWYISHSVSGVSESDYDNSFGSSAYALNIYNAGWDRIAGVSDAYTGDYPFSSPLEGYSVILQNSGQTLSYNGVLNSDANYSDTYNAGWHLVANPYPAYIDAMGGNFTLTDFDQTIYIRRNDDLISSYNLSVGDASSANEGSRYISPGQCMWLRASANNASVTIAKNACTHTNGGYGLKSAAVSDEDVLRLEMQSEYGKDEAVVIFNENGSELYTAYDSEKVLNGGDKVSLYSIKDGENIVVNSMPELEDDDVVPLGYYVATSGLSDFTLSVTNLDDFMPEQAVYLVDKELEITVDLREQSSYTFTPSTVQSDQRFELVFNNSVTTDIDDETTSVSSRNVLIYAVKQEATVKVTDEVLAQSDRLIEVYNISGQLVKQVELDSAVITFNLPQNNTIYIINVKAGGASYQQKVVSQK